MEVPPVMKRVELYDHMGRPLKEEIPRALSATWCQKVFYKGQARVGAVDKDGRTTAAPIREELLRAQVPYAVTLLVYHSRFDIVPETREYFVYASMEIQKAAELALRLWRRWEKPKREEFSGVDMREDYPKVSDGIVAEPITDSDFAEHWRSVRDRPHRAAGLPSDPFAFTCLDSDVKVFKTSDFQDGLAVKIR